MRLVEFLAAVKTAKRESQALAVLYWSERYDTVPAMTAAEVKSALTGARISGAKNANMPDVLSKAGAYVDVVGTTAGGVKQWALTETGRHAVRSLLGLPDDEPEVEHSVADLKKLTAKITDVNTHAYVQEAILCVSVGALRAAIVFVWVAAVAELKSRIWAKGKHAVNASILSRNANAKPLHKQDDLAKLNEAEMLNVAEDVGVLDKAQHKILGQALDVRNQAGHPNKYDPGVAKVKSHIEDITGILWV